MKDVIFEKVRREEMVKAGRVLSQLSFPPFSCILKRTRSALRLFPDDGYYVFPFQKMHNLHAGILKLLNNCFVGNCCLQSALY